MNKSNDRGATPRLVLERATGAAIIDGDRFELSTKEFEALVQLIARRGEAVSHEDLIQAVWGDIPGMTSNDVHRQMARLRRRIKDGQGRPRFIQNRRGFGYLLDLPAEDVVVVDRLQTDAEGPEPDLEHEASPMVPTTTAEMEDPPPQLDPMTDGAHKDKRSRWPSPLRPTVAVAAVMTVMLMFGGSWMAGYRLSQLGEPRTAAAPPSHTPRPAPSSRAHPDEPRSADSEGKREGGAHKPGRRGNDRSSGSRSGGGQGAEVGSKTLAAPGKGTPSDTDSSERPSSKSASGSTTKKPQQQPPPAPPQPDAHLYHLHDTASGDRYMTTSSAVSNQKQAAGYSATSEGRVFTRQVSGTIAITLDDGVAFIYRSRDAAPGGVSLSALYRLSREGDYFYTRSPGAANQAEAQGWARNVAGFVQ